MHKLSVKIVFITLLTLLLQACMTNIAGRKQIMLVSEDTAIQASKQAYADTLLPIDKAGKLNNDAKLVQRISRITDKLVREAIKMRPETQQWEWSIKVIDDSAVVNAWCMAGGKMAIYTGLITQLSATDDEIAQVMGHEISHALANHSAERMSMAMAQNTAMSILQSTTAAKDEYLAMATTAAQVALTLPNSRKSESEADKIGIELAAKAGFNPNAAVTLWQKMASVSGSQGFEFLSTHPSPQNRQETLQKMIPQMMPFYQAAKH